MKNTKYLPLLFVTPLLLCAKPALPPWAFPNTYEDFSVSDFAVTEDLGNGEFKYSLKLNNTGEEYLLLDYFSFYSENISGYTDYYTTECLAPKSIMTVNGKMHGVYEGETINYYANSYKVSEALTYGSCSYIDSETQEYDGYNNYLYSYKFEDYKVYDDYYVSYVVHAKVKGEDKYYHAEHYNFYVTSLEELNPESDIEIIDVGVVFGRNKRVERTNNIWLSIYIILGLMLVSPLGVALLTFFVPIIIVSIKPWRKKNPNNEN